MSVAALLRAKAVAASGGQAALAQMGSGAAAFLAASAALPTSNFIDETEATHFRARGISLPLNLPPNTELSVAAAAKQQTSRKRKPEQMVHTDGYHWMKYGQKASL
jgi:hypothetical protein